MKRFNTAGTCRPNEHYMVDITERIEIIRGMIAQGDYFCINRGRQYGKTTTLEAISRQLSDEYCIFQISFEGLSDSTFADEEKLYSVFVWLLVQQFEWVSLAGLDDEVGELIRNLLESHDERCTEKEQSSLLPPVELGWSHADRSDSVKLTGATRKCVGKSKTPSGVRYWWPVIRMAGYQYLMPLASYIKIHTKSCRTNLQI